MSILAFLYLSTGVFDALGVWPQLKIAISPHRRGNSISVRTFGTWSITLLFTLMYAIFENGDIFFILVTALDFLGCATIASAVAYKRWRRGDPIFLNKARFASNKNTNP